MVEQGRMQLGPDTEMLMPEGKLQTSSGASSINRDHRGSIYHMLGASHTALLIS